MRILEVLYAVIMGIIEGITEWLPISSTGHLIIADSFLAKSLGLNFRPAFIEMFGVVIQLGAILAIVVIFFRRLNPLQPKITSEERMDKWKLWGKVLLACIPAGVIGVLFNDKIDELFYNPYTVGITLIIYGILFIMIEVFNKKREFKVHSVALMSLKTAFLIGLFQLLALIPGTSRSGVTILGAMLLSCDRTVSAEFSFFLSIPIMVGASLVKLIKIGSMQYNEIILLIIGCGVAFLVSIGVVKVLMAFIKKRDFMGFGYYRIALGILVLILGIKHVI